ncbi:iron(III) transport system permease protein [Colwellia chukchiensis]|uniref:Iron(III) transport system permease protein n=1 Tax=Colwellia chukchiensis TaxID=641665 RepID=A0A1H7L681_9GAMM|nr:iron ABC transporter permease [Colwellia chukchiensis]SEK94344.1 iron(III) transport system permease protein [Colwellia chukchiensis]
MLLASLNASNELFSHLWATVLPEYITNTLLLALLVALLTLCFGVPAAALVSQTNLVMAKQLRWLLMLPLAMPAYLVAYLYTDLFDYAGPVQRSLRAWFGWQSPDDYYFFDIRTIGGAAIVIALVLFPYVYMLTRTAFEQQDRNLLRASRLLGCDQRQSFYQIALPLARPAIAVSLTLVVMETLADFATVQYFAVNTLTTAVYDTWLGYSDLAAANALASVLLLFILFVVVAEQRARAGQRHQSSRPNNQQQRKQLSIMQQLTASLFCWFLVLAGFLLPLVLLLIMVVDYADYSQFIALLSTGKNSIEIAFYSATIATIIALFLALFQRLHQSRSRKIPLQITSFGYAVPGTVLAMAMLATFGPIDHLINDLAKALDLKAPGLLLSGTVFAIVFAFVVRFSAIANGTINAGIGQIPKSLDFAPASLGVAMVPAIFRVHLPLLKSSILVAWLLVFVEAMKELPAVLLLRPFNFETLSTQVFQLISDERLEQGALGAVLIVLFGLLPIILLNRQKDSQ